VPNNLYTNSVFVTAEILLHTKMNTMDSNIDNAFNLQSGVLAAFGGDDRVIDDKDISTELYVEDSAVPDMNITVNTGFAIVSGKTVQNETTAVLTITAPTTNPRYSVVQISNEGVLSTVNGAEGVGPAEPSAQANNIKLAAIYLTQNAPKIDQTDLGDGYLIDRRTFSLHPTTVKRHIHRYIPGTLATNMGPNSDGFTHGTSAGVGFSFGQAVTIESVSMDFQDIPTGANVIFTFHNKTDPANDAATATAGLAHTTDSTIDLDFDAADVLAIDVTQVGSTLPGGWVDLDIQFILQ